MHTCGALGAHRSAAIRTPRPCSPVAKPSKGEPDNPCCQSGCKDDHGRTPASGHLRLASDEKSSATVKIMCT